MSDKAVLQVPPEEKGRKEAIRTFRDLFDIASVTVERIEDLLCVFYDFEDDFFGKDVTNEEKAMDILIDYSRYSAYMRIANFSLHGVLQELKQSIENASAEYANL